MHALVCQSLSSCDLSVVLLSVGIYRPTIEVFDFVIN